MYQKKVRAVTIVSIAIVFISAALAVVSVRAADNHLNQARLAHQLLEQHLTLSVHCYRLFKQLTDEIMLGRGANQAVVRNKRGVIKDVLARIRELEWQQRTSLGKEAVPNTVEDTDDLEHLIESIITDFEAVLLTDDPRQRSSRIDTILEDRIDISFREAVNAALERQRGVVQQMEKRVAVLHSRLAGFSAALAIGALLAGIFGYQLLLRGISKPLKSLQDGASRLAEGDLSHRVPLGFDAEFDAMAATFNSMASKLEQQHTALADRQRQLEHAVEERTREISKANAALENSDAVRRQFFADVSHELRTPITVIRGESQVALRAEHQDEATYRESLQSILSQSVALSRLVEDMLFIARADAQGLRLSRRQCDLVSLVQTVARDMKQPSAEKNIDIQTQCSVETMDVVADPDRIRQLMLVLIENALRYSPENTTISIMLTCSNNRARLVVADQGYGIDPQDLPYIFERFYRGQDTAQSEITGTGLGLAVAKSIVEAHGGEISAEQNERSGTQFIVTLPI